MHVTRYAMRTNSFWERTAPKTSFPRLDDDIEVDVAIIGGGITGITTAHLLSRAGKRVAVLEAGRIGVGTTGYSTGNLYSTVDANMYVIRDKWGDDGARTVAASRSEAVTLIEQLVGELDLRCGFVRCPQYLVATEEKQREDVDKEYEALRNAGVAVERERDVPIAFPNFGAIRLDNQAQFHPLLFVQQLADASASDSCRIFESSKATEIDDDAMTVTAVTGAKVHARHIVVATHTPKGFHVVQTELGPYREYGIAVRLRDGGYPPPGIFWDFAQPGHSVRSYEADGEAHLIVIGEKHKTGQHGDTDYYASVESFAREHFAVESVEYRWSAQHYRSADLLPFIGSSGAGSVYIATGFATNGLVYGPLSAMLISDDIFGKSNRWAHFYRASRFTPVKSAGSFLKENFDVAREYLRDYLTRADVEPLANIPPGDGGLVDIQGGKYAAYRSEAGEVTVLSPVCTHLKCIVHWNALDKSWDCPCHGSRFRPDGEVIEGPAIGALKKIELRD